jgi:hypothetical protein
VLGIENMVRITHLPLYRVYSAGMRLNPCEKWLVGTYFDLVSEGGGGGFLISPAILRNPLRPWDLCTAVRLLLDRISDTRGYKEMSSIFADH